MSRQELADEANKYLFDKKDRLAAISANYIGKLERGLFRWPSQDYREALRMVLGVSTDRELGFFISRRAHDGLGEASPYAAASFRAAHLAEMRLAAIPVGAQRQLQGVAAQMANSSGVSLSSDPLGSGIGLLSNLPATANPEEFCLMAPAGRFFGGAVIDVQAHPADHEDRILTTVPVGYGQDAFLLRARRALVTGVVDDRAGARVYAMDSRRARQHLAAAGDQTQLALPQAYALDELTLGLLWAVANLDEALLSDDRALASSHEQLVPYEQLPRSAVSRDLVNDLTTTSAMWLGSKFCARQILRNLDSVEDVPLFWTREQHGEEASTWLLFRHKYDYLRQLATRFPHGMARAFCVPPESTETSPPAERVLLLLTAALMESFGIRVHVVSERDYATVDGFALDQRRQAVIANWVRADGVWHVDTTTSRPVLRHYADAAGHADAHSVIRADSPPRRLRALADYLDAHAIGAISSFGCPAGDSNLRSAKPRIASAGHSGVVLLLAGRPAPTRCAL